MIIIAKETLCFQRWGLSPHLWLLVPTFSLPYAPQNLTVLLHSKWNALLPIVKINFYKFTPSVLRLSPDYFRRKVFRRVSCYALFKGWLLLSQPPRCFKNLTFLSALSVDFGTLDGDLGSFPFDRRSLAPVV